MPIESQPNNDLIVDGDIVVKDNNGVTRIRLDSDTGSIFVHNADGDIVMQWEMPGNNLRFGGHNRDGDLILFSQAADSISDTSNSTLHLDAQRGEALIGGGGQTGTVIVQNEDSEPRIRLDGNGANIRCGGGEGGAGDGDLLLFPAGANINNTSEASIRLNSANGNARIGSITFPDGSMQETASATGVITAVVAGDGLSGGGSSGEVGLSISQGFAQQIQSLGVRVQQLELAVLQLQQAFGP